MARFYFRDAQDVDAETDLQNDNECHFVADIHVKIEQHKAMLLLQLGQNTQTTLEIKKDTPHLPYLFLFKKKKKPSPISLYSKLAHMPVRCNGRNKSSY